jgi:hypothetical protein
METYLKQRIQKSGSEISFSSVTDISCHNYSSNSDIQMQAKHREIVKYRKIVMCCNWTTEAGN